MCSGCYLVCKAEGFNYMYEDVYWFSREGRLPGVIP